MLPQNARVLNVFLTLNFGVLIAVLIPIMLFWGARPTALQPAHHGWISWVLSALGVASAGWSIRDALAWRKLKSIS